MNKHLSILSACLMSISMWAATITVNPGTGTLKTAVTSAASGDVLVLTTGTYGVISNIDITTAKQVLTIQAAAGATPIISISSGSIRLKADSVQLTMDGITLEGTASSIRGLIVYSGIQNTSLRVNNCIFRNMQRAIYINESRMTCKDLHITNSSFLHIGDKDNRCIYGGTYNNEAGQWPVTCEVDHCTFYDCFNTRTVYFPAYNGSHVTNCICVNKKDTAEFYAYAVYGNNSHVRHCLAYKTGIKTSSDATQANNIFLDPYFVDAEHDNLQLYKNSPAVNAGTDGSTIGDPRWGVSTQSKDIGNVPIAERITKTPYSMSPTTSSIRILWQQTDTMTLGTVAYGTSATALNDTVRSRGGWMVDGEGYVHVVELTGLQPFTKYYYQVGDAKQMYEQVNSTKTAPNAGTAYRIFTISDIHVNSCKNWGNMQDYICTLGADLMMCNGDFVNNGAGRDWNTALFVPGKKFLSQTPIMSSTGNHETGDPLTYRWTTMFDYFSQFSHGASEDPIKDPRGEGYFGYDYGNARILAVSVSGEPASPDFDKNSNQFKWLENEIKNCTKTWILIFGHVGLTSSGYHGQWPPEYRDDWRALFEKYAAQGKHIIYFCGDDHSFEHAYKDGVHYVRPACGRNSNYAQVTTLKDAQYSMFYRQVSCYSTLDMAADGSTIHMISRDSVGNQFYEYTFRAQGEVITPTLTFTAPTTEIDVVDSTLLQWFVFDPQKDAVVNLYASQTKGATNVSGMISIASNLTAATTRVFWQTRNITPKGKYYLYATLTSGGKTTMVEHKKAVTLVNDTTPPPAPTDFAGYIENGHYHLIWTNPTHLIDKEKQLTDFSDGIGAMQEDSETGASSTLSAENGALKVVYSVGGWAQTSADYVFSAATDCHETPILHFRMKGNGSSTSLRIICKNMAFGHEDWWFTESINLSNNQWADYTLDLSKLGAFEWYANSDTKNQCDGLVRICFAVSTEAQVSGTYYLDDIRLTGQVLPAPDYAKTIIRRATTTYPTSITDGDAVYEGTLENYLDEGSSTDSVYYYSAFALDDRGNASTPAQWLSTNVISSIQTVEELMHHSGKVMLNGRLMILNHGTIYDAMGQVLKLN